VQLMLLGLRDPDAVGCIEHGVKKDSAAAASQLNPVDAVFRMAAHMSGVDLERARAQRQSRVFRRRAAVGAAAAAAVLCALLLLRRRQ
jgi:hypothetical protein